MVVGVSVKGDEVCGEGNVAELLRILLPKGMEVGGDTDGSLDSVEVSEGWGLLEGVYVIVFVNVSVALLIFA